MSGPTPVESLAYEYEDLAHVQAGADFAGYTRPYAATITGTLHLFVNGDEVTHDNKLPATFEVFDTARAQFELLEAVASDGQAAQESFCCPCSQRGCAYIRWEFDVLENDRIRWHFTDLVGTEIGEYVCSFEQLSNLVTDIHQRVIALMRAQDIQTLPWPDRKADPPRPYYGTVDELEQNRQAIQSFEPSSWG